MRHQKRTTSLGRKAQPRNALLRSLCHSLIMHGALTTTVAKAKTLQPQIERLTTTAKKQTLVARRQLNQKLPKQSAEKLYKEIAKKYAERKGGYTRITLLGTRPGDGAKKAKLEFL